MGAFQDRRWLVLMALFVAVTSFVACAKKDKGPSDSYSQTITNWHETETSIGGETEHVSYEFKGENCEISQKFVGTSEGRATRLLCAALRDNQLNQNCAETDRRIRYAEKCGFYSNFGDSAPSLSKTVKPESKDLQKLELSVWEATRNLWLTEVTLSPAASSSEDAKALVSDLLNCGAGTLGPRCLQYKESAGHVIGVEALSADEGMAVIEVRGAKKTLVAFSFHIKKASVVEIKSVSIYQQLKNFSEGSLKAFLADAKAAQPLVIGVVASDLLQAVSGILAKPANFQQLFHAAELMFLEDKDFEKNSSREKIIKAFEKNIDLIGKTDKADYQEKLLGPFSERLKLPAELAVKISEPLLKSKSETVKQIASLNVLESNPARNELRPVVRQMAELYTITSTLRYRAIYALKKSPTKEDLGVLIRTASSFEGGLSNDVVEAIRSQDLVGDEAMDSIQKMSRDTTWKVRRSAVKLLAKSTDARATQQLIELASDYIPEVRSEAMAALDAKSLNESHLQAIEKVARDTTWQVRHNGILLLSRLSGDNATDALIRGLSDYVPEVRNEAMKKLANRAVSTKNIPALRVVLQDSTWQSRQMAVIVIAKIKDKEVQEILLSRLEKEYVPEVKKEIIAALKK